MPCNFQIQYSYLLCERENQPKAFATIKSKEKNCIKRQTSDISYSNLICILFQYNILLFIFGYPMKSHNNIMLYLKYDFYF
jgi:hypothetical protein